MNTEQSQRSFTRKNTPLRRLLTEAEQTQAWLASVTGIKRPTITHIVNGRINPTDDEIKKIAKALECDPSQVTA